MIAIPHFGQTSSGGNIKSWQTTDGNTHKEVTLAASASPGSDGVILNTLLNPSINKFTSAPLDAIKAKNDKIAAEKEKARVEAVRKSAELALTLEKQRAIAIAPSNPIPVYLSGCTTYHSSGALEQLITHESGGNSCATNAGGCFGLLQACPGAPLRDACGGNPTCQISWFIANKTGGRSWEQIWAYWQQHGYW